MQRMKAPLLLFALAVAAPAAAQDEAYRLGAQARASEINGDLDAALALYDRQIALKPDVIAHNARGLIRSRRGDYAGAVADFDRAIGLIKPGDRDEATLYANRADSRRRNHDLAGALADYDQTIRLRPEQPGYYNSRARVHEENGDPAKALADLDKAVALAPDEVRYHENRATRRDDLGDLAGAIADYDELIEIEPEDTDYLDARALLHLRRNAPAAALLDARRSLALRPTRVDPYTIGGIALEVGGEFEEALRLYDRGIALDPPDPTHLQLRREAVLRRLKRPTPFAELARMVGRWQDSWNKTVGLYQIDALAETDFLAKAAAGRAAEIPMQQAVAYYYLGLNRLLAGDTAAARRRFQQCLDTKQDAEAEFILARAELARFPARP